MIENYELQSLIGEGNFGQVYQAKDKKTGVLVALKLEKGNMYTQLENEIEVYKSLGNTKGFAKLIDFGLSADTRFLVLSLLGPNLDKYVTKNRKTLTYEAVLDLAIQCLCRVKVLHDHSFIHRDLKPRQFLLDQVLNVSLIDFGLSRKYAYGKSIHIPYNVNRPFVGTLNYASYNTHLGIQQSRRDDLESYCYLLSYLVKGKLPWSFHKDEKKLAENEVKKLKNSVRGSALFTDIFLSQIFTYVKSLKFEDEPKYEWIFFMLNKSIQESKSKIFKVRFTEDNNSKSLYLKKSLKKKKVKSKLSKTIAEFSDELQDSSITMVSQSFPEIKDRKNFSKTSESKLNDKALKPESFCNIF